MYIFRLDDGTFKEAPSTFSPENPDFTQLKNVSEVLCISKVLVKQMKLVVKAKEEIQRIRAQQNAQAAEVNEQKPKRSRKTKGA
jgi:hypothetical protein